ncbi:Maltose excess protein 1, chloroplastic-like protein, partial [Drosera capensis]
IAFHLNSPWHHSPPAAPTRLPPLSSRSDLSFPSPSLSFPSTATTTAPTFTRRPHRQFSFPSLPFSLSHRRLNNRVLDSDSQLPIPQGRSQLRTAWFREWDWWTGKCAVGGNVPLLLLQLPQIEFNARNLAAWNTTALSAIPWLGGATTVSPADVLVSPVGFQRTYY